MVDLDQSPGGAVGTSATASPGISSAAIAGNALETGIGDRGAGERSAAVVRS